jgi:mannose/cellobiose epimerase-like protein (N-acyl-D-glucosamine 2-epimerase family)
MTTLPPLDDPAHRAALADDARAQLDFFRASLNAAGGFDLLDHQGRAIAGHPQELHATTRLIHSYALGHAWGAPDCAAIIDAGMAALWHQHRDGAHGGYVWSLGPEGPADDTKLAYGNVFVLLAAASAQAVGHDDAPRLMADVEAVIDRHFWDDGAGRLREEYRRDWQPFSTYRGMNANMHGAEAMLAAYEATGREVFLLRAGRILDFFTAEMAPAQGWRIPEHYTGDWQIDPGYEGDPMFRPAGTTPGHALEFARLVIQHWDLAGRSDATALARARRLVETALHDAWLPDGGLAYTLDLEGRVARDVRLWWPVTEALGALAALMKVDPRPEDAVWYRRLRAFAAAHFIDHAHGGWFPEIDAAGQPAATRFVGKPDIYHALQADLFPLAPGVSRAMQGLAEGAQQGG